MKFHDSFELLNFSGSFDRASISEDKDYRGFSLDLHDEKKCESLTMKVELNSDGGFTMKVEHDSFSVRITEIVNDTEIVESADISDWFQNYIRLGFANG